MGGNRSYSKHNPLPKSTSRFAPVNSQDIYLKVFDVCLIVLIVFCPLVFAGRHPLGQLIYSIVAGLMSLTWLVRQQTANRQAWIFTGLEIWGVLAILICAVQIIPLPENILSQLSPEHAKLLFLYQPKDHQHQVVPLSWHTLSVDPYETAMNLGTFCMFFLAGITLRQRIRTQADIIQVGIYLGVAGVLITVFALAQYCFTNGKFFWFYQHQQSTTLLEVKGPFTNANHFAGFTCQSLIPSLMLGFYLLWKSEAKTGWHRSRSSNSQDDQANFFYAWLCFGLFLMMVVAAILSVSRGALVLLGGELIFLFIVFCLKGLMNGKVLLTFIGLGFIGSIGLFLTADKIFEANSRELMSSNDVEQLDPNAGRRIIWQGNLKMIQKFPLFGTGLGSHLDIHTAYIEPYVPGIKFSHAENSYLNITSEAGCFVFAVFIILLIAPLIWNMQILYESTSKTTILIATSLLMGLIVIITHAMYDFNLYAPAISMIFLIVIVLSHELYRQYRQPDLIEKPAPGSTGKLFGFSRIALMMAISAAVIYIQLPPALTAYNWETYLRLSQIDHQDELDEREILITKINHLQQVVRIHPRHALAQTELAQLYLKAVRMRLQNQAGSMTIDQIKDTIQHGGFSSPDSIQEWLSKPKILGSNLKLLKSIKQRASYALSLNPTQYQALILLTQLGFIENMDQAEEERLLQQSLLLAPHQADVQLTAGMFYWHQGNLDRGLQHLQIAFNRSSKIAFQIVDSLISEVTADELIKLFRPNLILLQHMANYYASHQDQESLHKVSTILGEGYTKKASLSFGKEQANFLIKAGEFYDRAKLFDAAQTAFKSALEISPQDQQIRARYAIFLFQQRQYKLALPLLQTAYQHDSSNKQLRECLDICLKHQLTESGLNSTFR